MTKKELLAAIVTKTPITDEMVECALNIIESSANAAANRSAKAAQKKAAEDAPLVEACVNLLSDGTCRTASEIGAALNVTTSKATYIAKSIDGIKVGQTIVSNRAVKTYSL